MTKIVGILNITPDSFSDGGKFVQEEKILQHLQKMLEEGADVVDVGAQSTRPNADILTQEEEYLRLKNILIKLVAKCKEFSRKNNKEIELSIDTYHFKTAQKAVEAGFDMINDVSGLQDEKMIELAAKTGVKAVFMHSLSVPANPEIIINKALNVVDEILAFAHRKIKYLQERGIKKSQLIFDPGLGFSKDAEQSIRILKNINRFKELDIPIYIGHSKKSFLDKINDDFDYQKGFALPSMDRHASLCETCDDGNNKNTASNFEEKMQIRARKTVAITKFLMQNGVDYVRVHDVLQNRDNFR